MRIFLSLLKDYRIARLNAIAEKAGQPSDPARIAEVGQKFEYLDSALSGVNRSDDDAQRLAEVMTSADFSSAFGDFVQRQMLPGYQQVNFPFEQFMFNDTAPNFQNVTRKQNRSGVDDLEYVGEKGEARPGSVADAYSKQWRVYKWEKQFDFSMEAIVNDDLGYLANVASLMGIAARRTLERYVSRMLWNAVTVARLVGLGALYSTTGRLSTARISEGRMAFGQRTDAAGDPIPADLAYIVMHRGLVDVNDTIQNSTQVPENATNSINPVRGTYTAIIDPHLAGVAPNLPWMGLANYRTTGIIPFVLVRRQGVPGPWIGRKKSDLEFITALTGAGAQAAPTWGDFATGNIVVKVHDEFGTYVDGTEGNLVDFRGAYYSSGTAV